MTIRTLAFATLAAPLAIGLAACSSEDAATGIANGDPVEAIAAPEGQSWGLTAEMTALGGIQVGNPDAPVKLVEYASHTCSHCATFSAESHGPLEEYIATGVVSYELRNQIHDGLDLTIATLIRCGEPATAVPLANQAWASLAEIIQTAQANGEALNQAMAAQDDSRFQQIAQASGLIDFFAARGISRDQAMTCLANTDVPRQIVENSATQSEELNVTGTPTFFINGERVDGASWSVVEPALQAAGAR